MSQIKQIFLSLLPLHLYDAYFLSSAKKSNKTEPKSVEQKLLNKLMENYDARVRPVENASDVVNVSFSLVLQQIVDLVSSQQACYTLLLHSITSLLRFPATLYDCKRFSRSLLKSSAFQKL